MKTKFGIGIIKKAALAFKSTIVEQNTDNVQKPNTPNVNHVNHSGKIEH